MVIKHLILYIILKLKRGLYSLLPGTSISDRGRGHLFSRIAGQSYNLNQYDIDKYAPYDVYVNPVDDPEKLDKERAVNQSNWEQGLRMIGQIGNEITVGTAIGLILEILLGGLAMLLV